METISVFLPIYGILLSFILTAIYHYRRKKNEDYLNFLNKQINDFYGPLYVLTKAGKEIFDGLLDKLPKNKENKSIIRPPSEKNEYTEWRYWVENVFIPMNEKIEELIIKNGYLIIGNELPSELTDFIFHSMEYKVIKKQWEKNNFSLTMPKKSFPEKLNEYAKEHYNDLKTEQDKLIKKYIKKKKIKRSCKC